MLKKNKMQIELVNFRNADRNKVVERATKFFAKELKISSRKVILFVKNVAGLTKTTQTEARMDAVAPGIFLIEVDSRLNGGNLLETVSHEMVHLKQRVLGQARAKFRRGKIVRFWMGKIVSSKTHYYDLPREVEAYTKQRILVNRLFKSIDMFNDI